jgi:hypothetical protein
MKLEYNVSWLCLVAEKNKTNFKLNQMSESTKPTLNEAENGNKSKPLLSDVFVVKYENEIDALLKDLLYDERWMDDEDYKEVIEETFKIIGITKQKLSDDIEIGVKNGYTVEQQIVLLKRVLNVA